MRKRFYCSFNFPDRGGRECGKSGIHGVRKRFPVILENLNSFYYMS